MSKKVIINGRINEYRYDNWRINISRSTYDWDIGTKRSKIMKILGLEDKDKLKITIEKA